MQVLKQNVNLLKRVKGPRTYPMDYYYCYYGTVTDMGNTGGNIPDVWVAGTPGRGCTITTHSVIWPHTCNLVTWISVRLTSGCTMPHYEQPDKRLMPVIEPLEIIYFL